MKKQLSTFDIIRLDELKQRSSFLKRQEIKYLIHSTELPRLLEDFAAHYDLLTIDGKNIFHYDSCYFDNDQRCYKQHHQGKRHRVKVRTRAYLDNDDQTYFEVKLKKGTRTHKHRYKIDRESHGKIDTQATDFLKEVYKKQYLREISPEVMSALLPSMAVGYQRITLVHKKNLERLTIDFDLTFEETIAKKTHKEGLSYAVILESKSDMTSPPSKKLLKKHGIKTVGRCSKYCIGTIMLHSSKHNNFKQLMKEVKKIEGAS